MRPVVHRLLLVVSLALGGVLAVVSPASATTTVTTSVSIAGDAATVPEGDVNFWKAPYTSGGGNRLVGGQLVKEIATLDEGDYKVQVALSNLDGTARWYKAGVPEGVVSVDDATVLHFDGTAVNLSIEFPQIAKLRGRVTNADGSPAAGRPVLRSVLGVNSQRNTDADGYYDYGYVRAGPTTIRVHGSDNWGPAEQTLAVPASGNVVVDLVRPEMARLTGTITDAGTGDPIEHLRVQAYVQSSLSYVTGATTDVNGAFALEGLGTGPFLLRYEDPLISYGTQWSGGVLTSGQATAFSITPGATTIRNEALTARPDPLGAPHNIGGVVTNDQGAPLADIDVLLYDPAAPQFPVATAATDRQGRWGILTLPDLPYQVRFDEGVGHTAAFPAPTQWFSEFYPDAWDQEHAGTVTVPTGGTVFNVDAQLQRSAVVTINATDSTGSTDLNAGYRLLTPAGSPLIEYPPTMYGSSQSYLRLRPGTYKVQILGRHGTATNDPPLVAQWYGGGTSLATAKTLTVTAGQVVTGSVVLPTALKPLVKPTITGTPKRGKKLTVSSGSWNLMTEVTFSYRWLRGTKVVGKAKTYRVARADRGKRLTAEVTAHYLTLSTKTTKTIKIKR